MPSEPGNLSDLSGPGKAEWDKKVIDYVTDYTKEFGSKHFRLLADAAWDPTDIAVVDWDAHPLIAKNCLGDVKSMKFLDWTTPKGDRGRLWQDEYFEWRTIRDASGKLIRFEGTTEFLEYWQILGAHHPATALSVIGRFAGETAAKWQDVYGTYNPFATTATPEGRKAAFTRMMVSLDGAIPKSPYNNGQKAITFLSLPVSSMNAAVALFVSAARPFAKADPSGQPVPMTRKELLASAPVAAIDCRNSDPAMVAVQNELALAGKAMAFNDPVGVYIRGLKQELLSGPGGETFSPDWVMLQRGSRSDVGDGLERSQRIVLEVPNGAGFVLGDLIRTDTEEQLQHGYQLAELIKLVVYVNTSSKGQISESPIVLPVNPTAKCSATRTCITLKALFEEFDQSGVSGASDLQALGSVRRNSQ